MGLNIFKWFTKPKTYQIQIYNYNYDNRVCGNFTPVWIKFHLYHNIDVNRILSLGVDNFSVNIMKVYRSCLAEHRATIKSFTCDYIDFATEEDRVEFLLRMS